MKYAVEMGSSAMIYTYVYISSFRKTGTCILKLIGRIHRHTHTQSAW
jgi:hypothetical protein